jgi:hypothetical protein
LVLINALQYAGLVKTGALKYLVVGGEVYTAFEKSNQTIPSARVLVLGDSVCRQIYPQQERSGESTR